MPTIHPSILNLAQDLHCNVFIESGTYHGETYRTAVESGYFERVYSVEVVKKLYRRARKFYDAKGPYRVLLGRSSEVFASSIFPQCEPDDRIFFWLDGHYSAGTTGGAERPCPLVDELIAIRDFCPTQSVVIAIDDTDDFGRRGADTPGLDWPSRDDVERIAFQVNHSFVALDYTGRDGLLGRVCRGVLVFAFREPSAVWKSILVGNATTAVSAQSGDRDCQTMQRSAYADVPNLPRIPARTSREHEGAIARMRGLLGKVFAAVRRVTPGISAKLSRSPQDSWLAAWRQVQGDKTLRLDYNLDASSIVFDIGGYEGNWTSDIFSMYRCTIHVFEPVIEFAERIETRFSRNSNIYTHRFGLSEQNRKSHISVNRDSSSLYRPGSDVRDARLVRAIDFMQEYHVEKVDLMKINIEGGEYDLLDHLIDTGFVKNIVNIQVQFHAIYPGDDQRMLQIQQLLGRTHRLAWQYPWVWENWRSKGGV